MAKKVLWKLTPIQPVMGRLDQGLIFTCGRAEDFLSHEVFGVTITARCDIAQDKADKYSYLPIVRLRDWWHVDGCRILSGRARHQQFTSLRQNLRHAGLSESILTVESPRRIAETLFPEGVDGPRAKCRVRVHELVASLERIEAVGEVAAQTEKVQALCSEFAGLRRSLMDELVAHRLTGYYFLPQIDPDGDDMGYVVLLREVRHLPREIARCVAAGFPRPEPRVDTDTGSQFVAHLCFDHYDFAMPIGLLPSPLIEHIMQSFALLFTRIGLEDLPSEYLTDLWDRQKLGPAKE